MATGSQSPNALVPKDLRKQLALAVRSIQWSYAIFWSISSRKPGALEWCDGYYNGEIKTRKTVQATESDPDQLGLQRSDQLRELYGSLALGDAASQAKRPTAALSPEDLTDTEWYFLVCMSFVFNPDQGLPGRTLANNQTIWLRNAHCADTKVFARSLLAKSASIQTIVCFPHFGGVVELGTTELAPEDLDMIQHIMTSFLGSSSETVSRIPNYVSNNTPNYDTPGEDDFNQLLDCPDRDTCSPNNCSDDLADDIVRDESNLVEGVNGEAPQTQSWRLMDDAISNCLNNSATSSDCVSQTCGNPEMAILTSGGKKEMNGYGCARDDQECSRKNDHGFNIQGNEYHYHMVLSDLLKSSNQLILRPYFTNGSRRSSFIGWRNDRILTARMPQNGNRQTLLKKVLFDVARMHESHRHESNKNNSKSKPEADEMDRNHVLSERKRREKINERFAILGSLVPSGGKVDKVSILDHTIEYLRELEQKVQALESCKEPPRQGSTTHSKLQDAIERTSDNYGPNKAGSSKKQLMTNKRKACEVDKTTGAENSKARLKATSADNITVTISNNEALIEMRCAWRDTVLLDAVEALSQLNMDLQTVQSSKVDGTLNMTIKAKSKGLKIASSGVIRQALHKAIKKS